MIADPKPLTCGNCGHEHFTLYYDTKGIATVCDKCKVHSIITVEPAKITVAWGDMREEPGVLIYHPRS